MSRSLRTLAAPLLLVALTGLTACGGPSGSPTGQDGQSTGGAVTGELTVLAASSLTEVFTTLGEDFSARHPGVEVRFAFDSSATLADQAAQGAPADVLATADAETMQRAVSAEVTAQAPASFASNRLVLVVPAGQGAPPASALAELTDPDTVLVVCVPTAPCGTLATTLLDRTPDAVEPASLATDVKAVLAQVVADEADAGLVYASDVVAAGADVRALDLAGEPLVAEYLAAPLRQADDARLADQWVRYLASPEARAVLTDAGFDEATTR